MSKENEEFMLTTYDNPFNPFDDFEIWWKFDLRLGHDCCGVLAREALTSELYSDEVNNKIIKDATDEIVKRNPTLFRKVFRSDYKTAV